jgi:hypothetical protein
VKLLGVLSIPLIVRDHNINCRFFWSAIRPPEASSTLIIIFFVSRLLLLFSSLTLVCSTRRLSVMYIVSNRRHFSTHKLRSCELIGVYYKIIKILKSTKYLSMPYMWVDDDNYLTFKRVSKQETSSLMKSDHWFMSFIFEDSSSIFFSVLPNI